MEQIESYNFVCKDNAIHPHYELGRGTSFIDLYFTLTGEVIIVGAVDNNYIHWLSITRTSDTEINEQIFNYIANHDYQYVSYEDKALQLKNLDSDILENAYKARLIRGKREDVAWETPFGCYYGKDQIQYNGRFFANDVDRFCDKLRKKCEIREINGAYKTILKKYVDYISAIECMRYEADIKPISELLRKEDYLLMSPHKDIRDLYIQCRDLCRSKYNDYMTAVR